MIDPLLKGPLMTNITDPYELHTLLNFSLLDWSPLIDTGLVIDTMAGIAVVTHDFYGTQVPQGRNLEPGVYEWVDD